MVPRLGEGQEGELTLVAFNTVPEKTMKRIYSVIPTVIAVAFVVALASNVRPVTVYSVQAPDLKKGRIVIKRVTSNEPFELVEPVMKGKPIRLGQTFEETGDWLQNLRFRIRNKSDKPIIYIRVLLTFPETQSPGNPMRVYDVYFGQKPDERTHHSHPILLLKDDALTFALSQKQIENIETFLRGGGFSIASISKLEFWIPDMVFADGLMWHNGNLFRQDPNDRERWVRIP